MARRPVRVAVLAKERPEMFHGFGVEGKYQVAHPIDRIGDLPQRQIGEQHLLIVRIASGTRLQNRFQKVLQLWIFFRQLIIQIS